MQKPANSGRPLASPANRANAYLAGQLGAGAKAITSNRVSAASMLISDADGEIGTGATGWNCPARRARKAALQWGLRIVPNPVQAPSWPSVKIRAVQLLR